MKQEMTEQGWSNTVREKQLPVVFSGGILSAYVETHTMRIDSLITNCTFHTAQIQVFRKKNVASPVEISNYRELHLLLAACQ